ncbi:MAG: cupin domain-containing protein [Parvularculaceae bacterium]
MSPDEIIARLGMAPHPEGGHFVETFRDTKTVDARAVSTAIYFLLKEGERSHWHRIDAAEIWHYHAGAPLRLSIADERRAHDIILGRPRARRTPARRRAGGRMAGGGKPWRMDASRLHRRAGISVRDV